MKGNQMRLLLIICMLLAFSEGASAQMDRSRSATKNNPMEEKSDDNQPYSRSVTGKILAVNAENSSVAIESSKKGRLEFIVDKKTKMKADKDTGLAENKNISLNDYKPGDPVKIVYRVSDNKVLELRLKRPEN
jgi:hypothetical protein